MRVTYICSGAGISESLPLEISHANFYPLLKLISKGVQRFDDADARAAALDMLHKITMRVAKNDKSHLFVWVHGQPILDCARPDVRDDVLCGALKVLRELMYVSDAHLKHIHSPQLIDALQVLLGSESLSLEANLALYKLLNTFSRDLQLRQALKRVVPLEVVSRNATNDFRLLEVGAELFAALATPAELESYGAPFFDKIRPVFEEALATQPPPEVEAPVNASPTARSSDFAALNGFMAPEEELTELQASCRTLHLIVTRWGASSVSKFQNRLHAMLPNVFGLLQRYLESDATPTHTDAYLLDTFVAVCPRLANIPKDIVEELTEQRNRLERFVETWDERVNAELHRCLSTFFIQYHVFGVASIEGMAAPAALAEIFVEVMTDDRHGINEDPRMLRKVIEALTMIVKHDHTALDSKTTICDQIVDMYTDDKLRNDLDFLHSSLQFMIAAAKHDDQTKRNLCSTAVKVNAVAQHFSHVERILGVMLQYFVEAIPFAHKMDFSTELLFVSWMMRALMSENREISMEACAGLATLANTHGYLVNKAFSRPEIEEQLLRLLIEHSESATRTKTVLQALHGVLRCFNVRISFISEWWSYGWTYRKRRLLERWTSAHVYQLVNKHYGHRGVMAAALQFASALHRVVPSDERKKEIVNQFAPLLPFAFKCLTDGQVVNIEEMERPTVVSPPSSALPAAAAAPGETSQESPEASAALQQTHFDSLAFASVEALHQFLCDDSLATYSAHEGLVSTLSICESVSQVMLATPDLASVQKLGLEVLQFLALHQIDTALFGDDAAQALVFAMVACPQDKELHKSFALTVKYLAKDNTQHRHTLVQHGAHKWLFIVLSCQWADVTPHALAAVANLSLDEDLAKVVGSACLEQVMRVLDQNLKNPQVLVEGSRALSLMCRVPENQTMARNHGADRLLKRARKEVHHADLTDSERAILANALGPGSCVIS